MELNIPVKLTSALAKSLQYFCNSSVEFSTWAHVTGYLGLTTDNGQHFGFSVNEKVLKLDDNSLSFKSGSFPVAHRYYTGCTNGRIEDSQHETQTGFRSCPVLSVRFWNHCNNLFGVNGGENIDKNIHNQVTDDSRYDQNELFDAFGKNISVKPKHGDTAPLCHVTEISSQGRKVFTCQDESSNVEVSNYMNQDGIDDKVEFYQEGELNSCFNDIIKTEETDSPVSFNTDSSQQTATDDFPVFSSSSVSRLSTHHSALDFSEKEFQEGVIHQPRHKNFDDLLHTFQVKRKSTLENIQKNSLSALELHQKSRKNKLDPEKKGKLQSEDKRSVNKCDKVLTVNLRKFDLMQNTKVETFESSDLSEYPEKIDICDHKKVRSGSFKTGRKTTKGKVYNGKNHQSHCLGKPIIKRIYKKTKFECNICKKCFSSSSVLKNHLTLHTGDSEFCCSTCHKKFISASHLKRHLRIHTGERPYKCKFCEKMFSETSSLYRHIRIHTGHKPYQCTTCNRKFTQSQQLTRHEYTHTREKLYKCQSCDRSFTQSCDLEKHMMKHRYEETKQLDTKKEKLFTCSICGYCCAAKQKLQLHVMRMHTKEKPFKCSLCKYSYVTKQDLEKHCLRKHREEKSLQNLISKPFQCSTCGYYCTTKYILQKHILKHTGEKPYSCHMCEQRCSQLSNLRTHIKRRHGTRSKLQRN